MPRAVAFSAKQKRAQLLDKRAVKRGELDPSEIRVSTHITVADAGPSGGSRYARTGGSMSRTSRKATPTAIKDKGMHTTRLVAEFIGLTPEYLHETRDEAYRTILPRPIPQGCETFPVKLLHRDATSGGRYMQGRLVCPTRPKFRYDMTKEEVERNEEEYHARWMKGTEEIVHCWLSAGSAPHSVEDDTTPRTGGGLARRSPTWFETNLDVWRQLWRVTETSHIVLVLLDARCPPIHLPHSLRYYLQTLEPRKEVILVLTKSDLVDAAALEGWKVWLKQYWREGLRELASIRKQKKAEVPGGVADEGEDVQIVEVQSYGTAPLHSSKTRHRPDLPSNSLTQLVDALKTAHARTKASPILVRSSVDWSALSLGADNSLSSNHAASPSDSTDDSDVDTKCSPRHARRKGREIEREPLTIGLIGQPNVGKSSLLNALLGEIRVKAGKTPGKTKHFQTIFWGEKREVKIVDCPGLVCPSLVGLELQALCGVLPISQIPSLPACITTAAHLLPLERIFSIPPPPPAVDLIGAHRSRHGADCDRDVPGESEPWTAGMIMEGRAIQKGYITAKTGRPDINRAANSMMRQLAEGHIRWCFRSPKQGLPDPSEAECSKGESGGSADSTQTTDIRTDSNGIWLGEYGPPVEVDEMATAPRTLSTASSSDTDDVANTDTESSHPHANLTNETSEIDQDDHSDDDEEPARGASSNPQSFWTVLAGEGNEES